MDCRVGPALFASMFLTGMFRIPNATGDVHVSTSHVSTSHVSTSHVSTSHVSTLLHESLFVSLFLTGMFRIPNVTGDVHVSTSHVSTLLHELPSRRTRSVLAQNVLSCTCAGLCTSKRRGICVVSVPSM